MPTLDTPRLHLTPASAAHLRAELAGRDALSRALGVDVPPSWPPELYDHDAIRYSLNWVVAHPDQVGWGPYYIVRRADGGAAAVLIGAGGFKGAPDAEGEVEIGYAVLPEHQRRGYASEAVARWIEFAFAAPEVRVVVGQTLSHLAASIGVLLKAGFHFAGEGKDPYAPAGERVVRYELWRG